MSTKTSVICNHCDGASSFISETAAEEYISKNNGHCPECGGKLYIKDLAPQDICGGYLAFPNH